MSDAAMIRSFMARLIAAAGGVDPAAALIGARLGREVSKGSISKRQAGLLDWPLLEVWALEDALADPCISEFRSRSLPSHVQASGLLQLMPEVARESGEALAAVMDLASGRGNRDVARKEVAEAHRVLGRLAAQLEDEA